MATLEEIRKGLKRLSPGNCLPLDKTLDILRETLGMDAEVTAEIDNAGDFTKEKH